MVKMRLKTEELITYLFIFILIIGFIYMAFFFGSDTSENYGGEVEGEDEVKEKILEDLTDVEDELEEIEDLLV